MKTSIGINPKNLVKAAITNLKKYWCFSENYQCQKIAC